MQIKIASACVRGLAHAARQEPLQDAISYCRSDERAVIALSDGAGSSPYSQEGARIAVLTITQLVQEQFDALYAMEDEKLAAYLTQAIQTRLQESSYPLSLLKSTLLFYAVNNDACLYGHIGDGMMFSVDENEQIQVLSMPENGEEKNETFFISEENAALHLRLHKGKHPLSSSVLLCSDGSMASLYHQKSQTPAVAVAKLCAWLQQEDEELVSAAIERNMQQMFVENSKDDMSIIMVGCYPNKQEMPRSIREEMEEVEAVAEEQEEDGQVVKDTDDGLMVREGEEGEASGEV